MHIICDFPKWWEFPTYDGFNSRVNVNEGLNFFEEGRINLGKEEAGTSAFNQPCDKFQSKQDKYQTRQILDMEQQRFHTWIT